MGAIRSSGRMLLTVSLTAVAGCASARIGPLPLRPEPVAYADTLPIPEPGEQRERRELRTMLIHGPLQLAEPVDPGLGESLNLTHYDDVVSSAWWERRMGYRPIAPAALAMAHTSAAGAPAPTGVLTIKSLKTEGVTPGFNMEDEKDDSYVVKFDPPELPYLQSAAGVIVQRLMWGMGYHVPEDYITDIDPARLVVDEDATIEVDGVERPLTMEDVRTVLQKARLMNGRYHVIASRYVPGIPKGPILFQGVREDDPNDHFRHEYRRELRGLQVVSSWINNTDLREGNTLDVYVEPGYLRHYIIDFTTALGSASTRAKHPKDETERPVDLYRFVARLATLGLYSTRWETEDADLLDPTLGYLRGEDFDPAKWDATWTNPAFTAMTDADAYWAAKIIASFTDAHIAAAVETGGLPTPDLEATLSRILQTRRDKLTRYWFGKVSTIEEPIVAAQTAGSLRLSFQDLGIEQGVWSAGESVYDWRLSHPELGRSGSGSAQPRAGGEQLLEVGWTGGSSDRASSELAVLDIVTRRPDLSPAPARVYLRWNAQGYQVVGLTHGDPED